MPFGSKKGFFLTLGKANLSDKIKLIDKNSDSENSPDKHEIDPKASVEYSSDKNSDNSLSNAEIIAAELAKTSDRYPVTMTTFAPENLVPGKGLQTSIRRAGSSLKSFRLMSEKLFSS